MAGLKFIIRARIVLSGQRYAWDPHTKHSPHMQGGKLMWQKTLHYDDQEFIMVCLCSLFLNSFELIMGCYSKESYGVYNTNLQGKYVSPAALVCGIGNKIIGGRIVAPAFVSIPDISAFGPQPVVCQP